MRSPSIDDVRRMFTPFQVAASSRIREVEPATSETWPPMIPAMPVGPSRSHTRTVCSSNVRSEPSSVVIVSPSRAVRTMISPPGTRSRSKACSGCAVMSIT